MATERRKLLMQNAQDPARWEALQILGEGPQDFVRTELDTKGAEAYQRNGGFSIVPSKDYNDELGRISSRIRAGREPAPPPSGANASAESIARLRLQEGGEPVGPALMAQSFQDDAALAGRSMVEKPMPMDPDLAQRIARERARDAAGSARAGRRINLGDLSGVEKSVADFVQGTRLKGEAPPPRGGTSRPSIAVGKPGEAGRLRATEALRAPSREVDEEGVASRTAAPETPSTTRRTGDDEFAAAQDESNERALAVALSRAGSRASEAISGVRGDSGAYDALEKTTGNPVKDLLARREADKRKALEDPTSEQSQRLRAYVAKALPGVYSEEELASLTAADADAVTRYGEMRQRLEQRREDMGREDVRLQEDRAWRTEQADLARQDRRDARANAAADRNLRREEMQALMSEKAAQRQSERAEQQTRQFSDEVGKSGAPNFYSQYGTARDIIERNPDDLPGYGALAGRLPDALVSKEGVDLRQSLGQMLAEYRKGVTGAGMSDSERTEYGQITGLLQSGDEASVRQGAERLRQAMDSRLQAAAGGFRPDVVQEYGRRVPSVGAALQRASSSQAQGSAPQASTTPQRVQRGGKTYEFENGQWFEVL